jgi:hypothetical protein
VEIKPQPIIEEQLQSVSPSRPMQEEQLQQHVIEEQPQLVPTSRPMEDNKLQQPMNSGKEFLQELFEERLIHHYSSMPKIKNKNHDEAKRQSTCRRIG